MSRGDECRLLLLLRLWTCGQRNCVVQAKRHVHSLLAKRTGYAFAPHRHRRAVRERLVRASAIVQQGLRTPTVPSFESYCILGIRGPVFVLASMR
jgi:hypothetical protein